MRKKQIPISLVAGVAPTVTTRSGASGLTNYLGGAHFPILGIIVITDDKQQQTLGSVDTQALARAYKK